jgi:hypothetical protein
MTTNKEPSAQRQERDDIIRNIQQRSFKVNSLHYLYRTLAYSRDYYLSECEAVQGQLGPGQLQAVFGKISTLFFDRDETDLGNLTGLRDSLTQGDRYIVYGILFGQAQENLDSDIITHLRAPDTDFNTIYYDPVQQGVLMGVLLSVD